MLDGRRKPYSARVALRRKSPRNMPPICGTVTWLSSTNSMASSGRYSNRVGGGSPGLRPVMISEGHTSELQSLMRSSYAVLCLKKKNINELEYHTSDELMYE